MTTIAQTTTPLPEIPYRGIESLRFVDQRVFCSREEETWDLLSNILINRGVLLYGDSGSGKSSLINAGLIPAAIKENLYAHRLRVQPRRGREIKVERISTQTYDGPPYLLSDLVDPVATDDHAQSFEISLEEFYQQLDRLRGGAVDERRPLLIFDQFEEFVTLFEETAQGASGSQPKDAHTIQGNILNVLTSILQDEGLPVKLLFVFREEYLAKLNILFKAAPELLDQYVRLLPPRVEEAEQIILAPFVDEELKQKFATKTNHVRELEGLAKRIAIQIQQRSDNGFINLTELQIVCRKLWESRDPAKYFQSNNSDIQKVLEGYWVDALKNLGDLNEPSMALLGHMVTSTNTRNIVSEPDLKFFEQDNFSEDQITRALNALVDSKLVRREPRHKIYFYEIVSEFLVPWIREKKAARLAQLEANRLAAETKQRLKQVERERRYVSIFAIVLAVLFILSGYFYYRADKAYKSEKNALKELVEAQQKRAEAEELVHAISDLTNTDQQVRLAALKNLIELDRQARLPRNLVPIIVAVIAIDRSKEITYTGRYFYDSLKELNAIQSGDSDESRLSNFIVEAAEQNNVLAASQPSTRIASRIYFQLASNDQRARADKIAAALRSSGFIVPAYEIVEKGTPRNNELRYYRTTDVDQGNKDDRDRALAKVREIDRQGWSLVPLAPSSSVRPGTLELWFTNDALPSPSPSTGASPTPSPSPDVTLRLSFRDEEGRSVVVNYPRVTLERNPYAGRPLIVSASSLSAPSGNYILFVQVPGFVYYRAEIMLQGTEVNHQVNLKPTPKPSPRPVASPVRSP